MATKPIKVFCSPLSGKFYATQYYKIDEETGTAIVTGKKFDVTDDVMFGIEKYHKEKTNDK